MVTASTFNFLVGCGLILTLGVFNPRIHQFVQLTKVHWIRTPWLTITNLGEEISGFPLASGMS